MVEGAPLLRAYGSKAHRGFESLPLRQWLENGWSRSGSNGSVRVEVEGVKAFEAMRNPAWSGLPMFDLQVRP